MKILATIVLLTLTSCSTLQQMKSCKDSAQVTKKGDSISICRQIMPWD